MKTILAIFLLLFFVVVAKNKSPLIPHTEIFNYQCLPKIEGSRRRFTSPSEDPIVIYITNHVLNQISSRIFAIYLKEVLGYHELVLNEIEFKNSTTTQSNKVFRICEELVKKRETPALNLAVWMPSDYHHTPPDILMAGPFTYGRYGWFFPTKFVKEGDLPSMFPYTIFTKPNTNDLRQFVLDKEILDYIRKFADPNCTNCTRGLYIPAQCQTFQCATLLASSYKDNEFIRHHVEELKLYVNIVWLADNLKLIIDQYLLPIYERNMKDNEISKKFLVFHRTPSEIIDSHTEYEMITMPRCEKMISTDDIKCIYEMTALLKYHSRWLTKSYALYSSFLHLDFTLDGLQLVFELYDNKLLQLHSNNNTISKYPIQDTILTTEESFNYEQQKFAPMMNPKIYNDIACEWIKKSQTIYSNWFKEDDDDEIIYIGGIFPITAAGPAYSGLLPAVELAQNGSYTRPLRFRMSLAPPVNFYNTFFMINWLAHIKLTVWKMDGKCQADEVMKSFIKIYELREERVRIIGVLGPACSETMMHIADVSKQFGTPVISYSAEGVSFRNRELYPYLFRTIGENHQYEHVYLQLMQHLQWSRVAALTEDGQKYAEYIAHMKFFLKDHNIELIANKKFTHFVTTDEMNLHLRDLQKKNARIIIADVYDERSEMIMCEAYKLKMTAKFGYVWFLPVWLSMKTKGEIKTSNISCTEEQILEALNGHFSLQHAPYADDKVVMQENKTVAEWKVAYEALRNSNGHYKDTNFKYQSVYAGYVYDAVWVYALALNELIKENWLYLRDLASEKTSKRLIEYIKKTDFVGVSGRIRFGEGGSRFSLINVLQWFNGRSTIVGTFYPNISESNEMDDRKLIGGKLVLYKSNITWLYVEGIPTDGTEICIIGGFADFLNLDCANAGYIILAFVVLVFVILASVASYIFWKRQYDQRLQHSAKIMRTFGIDLLSQTSAIPSNSLDKWEVPKDRVVINRRLGEGAFGTVYGGEARIKDGDWKAIAVKTLKMGSSMEDRLDFLCEAEVMKRFDHNSILKLLGVCLQTEPIYTIMEFMLFGDLKTYLLARRNSVGDPITDDSDISPLRLTNMALDISRALAYLAENKYVHRDVACRNCLVNSQRRVKLGDFGMARPMYDSDYYKFTRKGMLPVRWMAPESLGLGIFSPASDVWSFGVLIYEIITFGSYPFQGQTNNQVLQYVKSGNTLTIPIGVRPQLEGLMKACWNSSYKQRPKASEIAEFISGFPRLIVPCLDVPLAAVQLPEVEDEVLPEFIERYVTPPQLKKSTKSNSFDHPTSTLPNGIVLSDFNVQPDSFHCTANTCNPIEPLLSNGTAANNSRNSLNLRRYVSTSGLIRSNRSLIADTSNI